MSLYKKITVSLSFLTIVMSCNSFATDELPNNYAYGANIELSQNDAVFSQLSLDEKVYLETKSMNLDDVRIFNSAGQLVPFSIVQEFEENNVDIINFDVFPVENKSPTADETYTITLNEKNISIDLPRLDRPNSSNKYAMTYLLKAPEKIPSDKRLKSVYLDWLSSGEIWQGKVSLFSSYDMKYWSSVVKNEPILEMRSNNANLLKVNHLNIPYSNAFGGKYWLLRIESESRIPNITAITANIQSEYIEQKTVELRPILLESDNKSVIYQLNSPQKLNQIGIQLAQEKTVQPLAIYYKSDLNQDSPWIKLQESVIRNLTYNDTTTSIDLPPKIPMIQQIKLEAINSNWNKAPDLLVYRPHVNVVFYSANNAPFILAWGTAEPKSVSLPIESLLPATTSVKQLPKAYMGDAVSLGGEKALESTTPKSAEFPKWIIWLALVAGVLALVFIGYKLSNEIKKTGE